MEFVKDELGEIIKYACIKSVDLYELLIHIKSKEELFYNMVEIILTCCNIGSSCCREFFNVTLDYLLGKSENPNIAIV